MPALTCPAARPNSLTVKQLRSQATVKWERTAGSSYWLSGITLQRSRTALTFSSSWDTCCCRESLCSHTSWYCLTCCSLAEASVRSHLVSHWDSSSAWMSDSCSPRERDRYNTHRLDLPSKWLTAGAGPHLLPQAGHLCAAGSPTALPSSSPHLSEVSSSCNPSDWPQGLACESRQRVTWTQQPSCPLKAHPSMQRHQCKSPRQVPGLTLAKVLQKDNEVNPVLQSTPKIKQAIFSFFRCPSIFIPFPPCRFLQAFQTCGEAPNSSPALLPPGPLKSESFSAAAEACPAPADMICVFLPSLPLLELSPRGISSSSLQGSAAQNRT